MRSFRFDSGFPHDGYHRTRPIQPRFRHGFFSFQPDQDWFGAAAATDFGAAGQTRGTS